MPVSMTCSYADLDPVRVQEVWDCFLSKWRRMLPRTGGAS
jgi:hypothetical protein